MVERGIVALSLLLIVAAGSASAELPAGYQVLLRGASVDAQALPPLVLLPEGPFSTIGLGVELIAVPHVNDDWILYETDAKLASAMKPAQFTTTALTASYYDPIEGRTRAAFVLPGQSGGTPALALDGGETDSLENLLEPPGAMVLIPVPEPAILLGLTAGVGLLVALGRRTRSSR